MDPAVEKGIAESLYHGPPFTPGELETMTYLEVENARDLSPLRDFPALQQVRVIGCDPVDLGPLAEHDDLTSVFVNTSGFSDASDAPRIARLLRLEVRNNFLADIAPLLGCPRVRTIDVTGNPLSEESYRRIVPALREKGVAVHASDEREWRITLALHEAGLPFCYYKKGDSYRLCRPGLARTDRPQSNHPMISPDDLEKMLERDPSTVEALFEREDLMPRLFPSDEK